MKYPAGTLELDKIQDALYDWIKSITQGVLEDRDGIQVIWRNQSEALPKRPCVTLKFIAGPSPTDRDGNVISGGTGVDTVGMQMEATLSIQFFGNTQVHRPMAHQLAVDMNSSLMLRTVRRTLKHAGVAILVVGKPQNMSALEESEYEERSGFELELGMVQNVSDEIEAIEKINITGTVGGEPLAPKQVILP